MTITRMLVMAVAVAAVLVALPGGVLDFEANRSVTKDGGAAASVEARSPAEEADPAALEAGVPCRKLTQTIDIGGQAVPASAMLCREGDGSWRLNPPQGAPRDPVAASDVPADDETPAWAVQAAASGRRCVRGGLPCGTSRAARQVSVMAARPHYPPEAAIDRPNR